MLRKLFNLLWVTSFLGAIGYNTILSLPQFIYILIAVMVSLYIISSKKLSLKIFLFFSFIINIIYVSNLFNYNSFLSFFFSSIMLIVLIIPFLKINLLLDKINPEKYVLLTYYTINFVTLIVIIELALSSLNIKPNFSNYLFFVSHQSTYAIGKIYRVKALMPEPAHFAIISVFTYIVFDLIKDNNTYIKKKYRYKIVYTQFSLLIYIMLTFSLSGILVLTLYMASRINRLSKLLSVIIFLFIVLYFFGNYFILRLDNVLKALLHGSLESSAGVRINSFVMLFNYLKGSDLIHFLFGVGYANYEKYIIAHFGYLKNSVLAVGSLQNIFSVIGISMGSVGLFLYLYFLGYLFKVYTFKGKRIYSFLVLVLHFLSGYLIIYWLWYILILGMVLTKAKTTYKGIDCVSKIKYSNCYN